MHSDIRLSASRLIRDSFVYLKMPDALISMFDLITASFESVESSQKQEFSFESETDGFLPFGLEYVDSPARPDLCERFCYWQARHQVHQKFSVAGTEFYNAVSAYELAINTLAQDLLDAICQNLGGSAQAAVRNNSYLQFCVYKPDYRRTDREYLQDPHEDGHLLSFIKPTLPGLILLPPFRSDSSDAGARPNCRARRLTARSANRRRSKGHASCGEESRCSRVAKIPTVFCQSQSGSPKSQSD